MEECVVCVSLFVISVLFCNNCLWRASFFLLSSFDNIHTAVSEMFGYEVPTTNLLQMKQPIFCFFVVDTGVHVFLVVVVMVVNASVVVELLIISTTIGLLIAEFLDGDVPSEIEMLLEVGTFLSLSTLTSEFFFFSPFMFSSSFGLQFPMYISYGCYMDIVGDLLTTTFGSLP